jgi:hypothetical protein
MSDNGALTGGNEQKTKLGVHITYVFALIVIVVVFSVLLERTGKTGSLKVQFGESMVEMKLDEGKASVKELLDFLFGDEVRQRETKALLKEFHHFYKVTDSELISEIEVQQGTSEVSEELRGLLYGLRGPFERSLHTFYNIERLDIISAIEKLGFDHPISNGLRGLLNYRKGPFEEQATQILVSVPKNNLIKTGRAASCKENKFFRRSVRIFNKQLTRSIDVYVSGRFPCKVLDDGASALGNLLQLSFEDMKELIGDSSLMGKEIGFAELNLDPK